jgi:hypothetical protein
LALPPDCEQLGTQAETRTLLPVTASRFVVGVPPHAEALVSDEQAAAELSHNQDPVIVEWDPPSTAHLVRAANRACTHFRNGNAMLTRNWNDNLV